LLSRTAWKHGFTLDFARSPRPFRESIEHDLAKAWAHLGVKLMDHLTNPHPFENWAQGGILAHGAFQVTDFAFAGGTDPDGMKTLLESRFVARDHPSRASDADQNYAGIRDRVIDSEFERGESSITGVVRTRAFHRVQERLNQRAYWVPLFYPPDITTSSRRIEGFHTSPVLSFDAMYAYLWKVK